MQPGGAKMLTRLVIRNFKQFEDVEVELGNPVVFVGPNNSGKTTALQALALWDIGLRRWNEKRAGKKAPEQRPGVTINRRDLSAIPIADTNLLWRNLHVRNVERLPDPAGGKPTQQTSNVRMDILVEGITDGKPWSCGLEFDYANEESFYCRPLRVSNGKNPERMPVPDEASAVRVAFLGPMSGLAASETRLDPGAINVCLGEGRTAEVLRNLCYEVLSDSSGADRWSDICSEVESLFGVKIEAPKYIRERGELVMSYRTRSGVRLDLVSAGRGLQQTLLLLAHLNRNPKSVLLIDEPDAHLEILRQREIYRLLTDAASRHGSQIIIASHSEVVLNEAADRHVVVAFVGTPHRIDDRGSQVLKALNEIGFDQYYQAEQSGWVLYLEGSTDLAILQSLAKTLEHHPAQKALERPFVHYVLDKPQKAIEHFYGLQEAKGDLVGFALFDNIGRPVEDRAELRTWMWQKREIENYLCQKEVLLAWAKAAGGRGEELPLLEGGYSSKWLDTMEQTIAEIEAAMAKLRKGSPWSPNTKVSDDFLDPLFESFFEKLGLRNMMRKTNYHEFAGFVPRERIDPEIIAVLDLIAETAGRAHPQATEDC
jgi:ABC-type hemin transport system ATPase subunit